jgi:EAL domain-containing protein (putative c-di-GMP-specific phosphodiesterase class I)
VLKAVVDMFKKLNFDLIIEGIENEKQLTFIRKIGLNKVQGYLYAKPEPISEFSTKKKRGKMVC